MKNTIFFFVGAAVFMLTACQDEPETAYDINDNRYLPLKVGNYWKLEPEFPGGIYYDIRVTNEVLIEGKNHFVVTLTSREEGRTPETHTRFYRIDPNTFVYVLADSSQADSQSNMYRLGVPDTYSWSIDENLGCYVEVKDGELGNNVIPNCKTFHFSHPDPMVDLYYYDTFAKDTGFVEIGVAFMGPSRLVFATLNGVDYDFSQ